MSQDEDVGKNLEKDKAESQSERELVTGLGADKQRDTVPTEEGRRVETLNNKKNDSPQIIISG